jgi:hypothetical protein
MYHLWIQNKSIQIKSIKGIFSEEWCHRRENLKSYAVFLVLTNSNRQAWAEGFTTDVINVMICPRIKNVALSPQANYTDWATATCRRNLVPTFVDRGVSRGQRGGFPAVVNLSFLDRCPRIML